jgi:hypothetical protein
MKIGEMKKGKLVRLKKLSAEYEKMIARLMEARGTY